MARGNIKEAGLESVGEIRHGRALDVLPQLKADAQASFDLIFMDADKPPFAEYFAWALHLSRPGTLIITDNVIREGRSWTRLRRARQID